MSEVKETTMPGSKRGGSRLRMVLAIVVCVLAVAGIAARIVHVNTTTPKIPLQHFEQGTWVPLEGAFQLDSMDDTDGYELYVEGATICSHDDYLRRHGVEPANPGEYGDATSVVDVTIRVKNEGDSTGGLDMFSMVLIPEGLNTYYICDTELWALVQGGAETVSIRSGTEFTMHVPYTINSVGREVYETTITGERFWLLASRMPERKMIEVLVDE